MLSPRNKNDGGYVIMETDGYDLMLSGGIGGDIGFERRLLINIKQMLLF